MKREVVQRSYDAAAQAYADRLADELRHKPLDRRLLDQFADEARGQGLVADLGCGPGHVTRYLQARGLAVIGVDLSPKMIEVARRLYPDTAFLEGDLLGLHFSEQSLAGIVLFYSIVHFDDEQLAAACAECHRELRPGAPLLMAFHVGDDILHVDELCGVPVSLGFRSFSPATVTAALERAGFDVIEVIEREPYPGVEYPSRRAYVRARSR